MNTEQINALFEEWERPQGLTYKAGVTEVAKAFAAYCLSKRETETGLKDARGAKISYGDTIESFDSDGKSVRHTIEKDAETGRPIARYGKFSTCDIWQNWINQYEKVIVSQFTPEQNG